MKEKILLPKLKLILNQTLNNNIMKNNIPEEYQSFEKLTFCSNILIGVRAIFKVGENEPLIIGKGLKLPAIWLKTKTKDDTWISVVERSISLHSQIKIINDMDKNTTIIKTGTITILKAMQVGSNCIVEELNLTPIGLNIIGDSHALKVGESVFEGNTFKGLGSFLIIND